MSVDIAVPHQGRVDTSKRRFFQHYLEMIAVMLVAMLALGGVVSLVFGLLGHSNLLHYAGLRAFVMTANMTIGMTIWMRFRGHGWASTVEMDGAMVLPIVLLIGPYWAGVLSAGALLAAMHALMLPFMFVVMLRRYNEYAQDHRSHSTGHVATSNA
jgi:peptidoglycan/LPS O-acetylase OafA/YrhL